MNFLSLNLADRAIDKGLARLANRIEAAEDLLLDAQNENDSNLKNLDKVNDLLRSGAPVKRSTVERRQNLLSDIRTNRNDMVWAVARLKVLELRASTAQGHKRGLVELYAVRGGIQSALAGGAL